jgi:hypothetical protein
MASIKRGFNPVIRLAFADRNKRYAAVTIDHIYTDTRSSKTRCDLYFILHCLQIFVNYCHYHAPELIFICFAIPIA